MRRDRLVETVASLSPCLIGMEACSGAHEWGRRFEQHGHRVKLMAPKFVAPYRKSDKNDGNDAEAVCEAVTRPNMRFVPVKSTEQQALLALHRVRQGFVVERTAIINRLRGLHRWWATMSARNATNCAEVWCCAVLPNTSPVLVLKAAYNGSVPCR